LSEGFRNVAVPCGPFEAGAEAIELRGDRSGGASPSAVCSTFLCQRMAVKREHTKQLDRAPHRDRGSISPSLVPAFCDWVTTFAHIARQ
jgi:hypothetical protein